MDPSLRKLYYLQRFVGELRLAYYVRVFLSRLVRLIIRSVLYFVLPVSLHIFQRIYILRRLVIGSISPFIHGIFIWVIASSMPNTRPFDQSRYQENSNVHASRLNLNSPFLFSPRQYSDERERERALSSVNQFEHVVEDEVASCFWH